jgi:hypothetical protein
MTERNIDVSEVLIGQVLKYRNIDFVVCKAFRVFGQAELLEPVLNLLHRGPTAFTRNRRAKSLPVLAMTL